MPVAIDQYAEKVLGNPKLRTLLSFAHTVLPSIAIYAFLGKWINYVVHEIVRSQML